MVDPPAAVISAPLSALGSKRPAAKVSSISRRVKGFMIPSTNACRKGFNDPAAEDLARSFADA
jgi:hypothetical protein